MLRVGMALLVVVLGGCDTSGDPTPDAGEPACELICSTPECLDSCTTCEAACEGSVDPDCRLYCMKCDEITDPEKAAQCCADLDAVGPNCTAASDPTRPEGLEVTP